MSTTTFRAPSSSSARPGGAALLARPRSLVAATAPFTLNRRARSPTRDLVTLRATSHSRDQRESCSSNATTSSSGEDDIGSSSANAADAAAAPPPTLSRRHSLLLLAATAPAAAATTTTSFPSPAQAAATPQQLATRLSTPPLAPPTPLSAREQALVAAVARASRSVARVTDVSLPRANASAGPQNAIAGVPQGNGSGVLVDVGGGKVVLLTCYHVLSATLEKLPPRSGADESKQPKVALVTFSEEGDPTRRTTYDGFLVGYDRARDLAVLRVGGGGGGGAATPLQPLEVAPASSLRVGQAVVAIGSPFGFDGSVSAGVVSALGVAIPSLARQGATLTGCVAFDAAANPGSSGGALVDAARGALVGVPTAIFTPTGVSAGQGFAIPAEGAVRAAASIAAGAQVTGAGLGVLIASEDVKARLGLAAVPGALIQQARPGGAAERAGLKGTRREAGGLVAGDVIAAVDGRAVSGATALAAVLAERSAGEAVKLTVVRGGGKQQEAAAEVVDAVLDDE